MINLLTVIPNPNDATAFYRSTGPLAHLRENFRIDNEKIELIPMPQEDSWPVYRTADAVFMQRPSMPNHVIAMDHAHKCGRKVWIDYDDDYFGIESDNAMKAYYREQSTKDRIKQLISSADVVSVSTTHIKNVYDEFNKNVIVIPNAMDETMFHWRNPNPERKKVILWRGTGVHQRGLIKYHNEIVSVAKEYPDWEWIFLGDNPWKLVDDIGPKATHVPLIDSLVNYFTAIHSLQHSIQMVCEHDSSFTRGKSNIAWMEAAFAGAVTVCPDWKEWEVPGTFRYYVDFSGSLHQAIDCHKTNFKLANESWDYIQKNLTLKVINKKRLEVLRRLLGGAYGDAKT